MRLGKGKGREGKGKEGLGKYPYTYIDKWIIMMIT